MYFSVPGQSVHAHTCLSNIIEDSVMSSHTNLVRNYIQLTLWLNIYSGVWLMHVQYHTWDLYNVVHDSRDRFIHLSLAIQQSIIANTSIVTSQLSWYWHHNGIRHWIEWHHYMADLWISIIIHLLGIISKPCKLCI